LDPFIDPAEGEGAGEAGEGGDGPEVDLCATNEGTLALSGMECLDAKVGGREAEGCVVHGWGCVVCGWGHMMRGCVEEGRGVHGKGQWLVVCG